MDAKNYRWLVRKKGEKYTKEKILVIELLETINRKKLFYTSLSKPYLAIRIEGSDFYLFSEEDEADEYIKAKNSIECKT